MRAVRAGFGFEEGQVKHSTWPSPRKIFHWSQNARPGSESIEVDSSRLEAPKSSAQWIRNYSTYSEPMMAD